MAAEDSGSPPGELERLLRTLAQAPEISPGPDLAFELGGTSRFQVRRRLGAGGFGVVWLARDLSIDADVALKTLPMGRPDLVYRLKREFRSMADLRHENLVSLYELFAGEDQCFFTMEYVPGETFVDWVRPGGRLDEDRLRAALVQLERGLSTLHQAGMLHRDVKPSNVLVAEGGRLVLLDFGLATEIEGSGLGRSAEVAGTPEYMSPEHAEGAPLSPATDWYSVGIMLYTALTGRSPFEGPGPRSIAERRRGAPAPPELPPQVSPDIAELCRALLSADPAARPSGPEVAAVAGRGPARRSVARPREPSVVGREDELARLREALRLVADGRGVTVMVEGASGVGKTALVQHFLGQVEQGGGAVVLRGRCYERERVSYQGIDSLVDDLCRHLRGLGSSAEPLLPRHAAALVRLFPVLEGVPRVAALCRRSPAVSPDRHEVRRQGFAALRDLLGRISERQPLVAHIDDLQWGDRDTGALLEEILRPPDAPTMLLVLGFRGDDRERSACLQVLERASLGPVVRLEVGPLTPAPAAALARQLLGPERPDVDAARLASEAGGNPFFIQELARFALLPETGASPQERVDLQAALGARLERLPQPARGLLEVVAVAGHPITETVARRAAGLTGPPWEAWAQLSGGLLVRFAPGPGERRVEPTHDRIREAVLAGLPAERALECNRGLAAALEGTEAADPEVLARVHEAAGHADRARQLAALAGEEADRALAFDRAARLFRWALQLAPPGHAERGGLLASLAGALANAGRGVEAAEAYLDAAQLTSPPACGALRRQAAEQLLLSGRIDEGRELATAELRADGLSIPRTPRRTVALLLLRRALIRLRGLGYRERPESEVPPERLALLDHLWGVNRGLSMVDVLRGADFVARYLLRALSAGEPRRVAQGLALEAAHAATAAPFERRTEALFRRLDGLDGRLGDPRVHGHVLLARGVRTYCGAGWREALALCDESERTFRERCTGVTWEIWTMRTFATWSLYQLGEWRDLGRRVGLHLAEARDRGNVYATTVTRVPFGLVAWLARGDLEGARRNAREAIAGWSVQGFHLQHTLFLQAETLLDLYAGDASAAWARVRDAWPRLARSLLLRIPIVRAGMLHARTGCALAAAAAAPDGARRGLLEDASRGFRQLERSRLPYSRAMAAVHRAALSAQLGRTDDAVRGLEGAAASFERLHMGAYLAAVRRRLQRLRGDRPPAGFLEGQEVADPDALTEMLAPGFPRASGR